MHQEGLLPLPQYLHAVLALRKGQIIFALPKRFGDLQLAVLQQILRTHRLQAVPSVTAMEQILRASAVKPQLQLPQILLHQLVNHLYVDLLEM